MQSANPYFSYTAEEEPYRQRFLRENPNWDCERDKHVVGDMIPTRRGFASMGCCWVCGKAVA